MKKIKAGKWLQCGCCGEDFKTWAGYIDQDQDRGYGICMPCKASIEDRNREEMQKLINCLRGGLNPDQREQLDNMQWELQAAIALEAMEEGYIKASLIHVG